jgi:hypothetical protein
MAPLRARRSNGTRDEVGEVRLLSLASWREDRMRTGRSRSLPLASWREFLLIRSPHVHRRTRLEIRIGRRFGDRLTKLLDGRQSTGLFATKLDQTAIRTV